MKRIQLLIVSVAAMFSSAASAVDFTLGTIHGSVNNRFTLASAWRVESRDSALLGKLNINPDLCPDGCMSLSGDPEPNQRLVAAPGSFLGHEQDDGNLNYDPGDMTAGLAKLTTGLSLSWGEWQLKARGIAFYDFVNTDFDEKHPNTSFQPAKEARGRNVESLVGEAVELHDLVLSVPFNIGENYFDFSVGQQKLRWGESNVVVLNSLSEINPPDGRRLHQPGFQINELFLPVPMAVIGGEISPDLGISMQAFYQFGWRPVIADPGGSFYSDSDALYRDGSTAIFGLGNYPEDPNKQNRISNDIAALLTDTSFTTDVLQGSRSEPRDGEQYGVRLTWFTDFLMDSTEWNVYAMNYHSRLPYVSARAAERTCLRDAVNESWVAYLAACQGFVVAGGQDPLPLDTMQIRLEYPEDIQLYGLSFNTNLGKWLVAGEYAIRPNLPLQVSTADITWAALQPAFPENDIIIGTEQILGDLGGTIDAALGTLLGPLLNPLTGGYPITVPGARNAVPDIVETEYRGHAATGSNDIRGYERFTVDQLVLNGLRIYGSSHTVSKLLGTSQIIMLLEAGVTHIWNLPSPQTLLLESGSPQQTHVAPAADGSGQPDGQPDTRRQNPTQQRDAFVTEWSWGYRAVFQLQYNDIFGGMTMRPFGVISHDLSGTAPRPMQNFLQDRLDLSSGFNLEINQYFSAKLQYNLHTGNDHYSRRDRDNIAMEFNVSW